MKYFKGALPELSLKYKTGTQTRFKIQSSHDTSEALSHMFDKDTIDYQEEFICIFLNQANNSIGWIKLASGGIASVAVDVRMIFATALTCGATSIIVSHNHPSGRLKPSKQDINLTKRIVNAGSLLGIPLLDHLIVNSEGDFFSFNDEGLI